MTDDPYETPETPPSTPPVIDPNTDPDSAAECASDPDARGKVDGNRSHSDRINRRLAKTLRERQDLDGAGEEAHDDAGTPEAIIKQD